MYRILIRPLLFLLPSETAHQVAMGMLRFAVALPLGKQLVSLLFGTRRTDLAKTVFGIRFPNPLGIAAGFDKNARYLKALSAIGFGFIEIGTVTPRPQPGNPKPRLLRLKKSQALINRMGFNNDGCEAVASRLAKYRNRNFVLGVNIGKNKDTPNEKAVDDYVRCFDALHPYADYFVVNVSSPNTPGLRELQEREPLKRILEGILEHNRRLPRQKPVLLKIAPDLSNEQLDVIVSLTDALNLSGIVACNTTVSREGLKESPDQIIAAGSGGLSGRPLRSRADAVIAYLHQRLPPHILIIGAGGVDDAKSAKEKLDAGAALIQVYTGFIYQGPGLVKRILNAL